MATKTLAQDPAAAVRWPIRRIAVAVDGSPEAQLAVELTAQLAKAFGAEVTVLHFREKEANRYGAPAVTETTDDIQALIQEAAGRLTDAGVTVGADVEDTSPMDEAKHIAAAAERFGSQLIVLGSRGLSTGRAAVQGSVSHDLIHTTRVPVLIAR